MPLVPEIPLALRIAASKELRRRRAKRAAAEFERVVVVMPDLDPLPDPPADDVEAADAEALASSRTSNLAALLEEWRRQREQGGGNA